MTDHTIHYDTIIKLATAITECKNPEDVALVTTESVKTAFKAKGCALFLLKKKSSELELIASYGLSNEYLQKGPLAFHAIH